ncbi:hypothetical protein T11_18134 [Trichinella zimbabwensis]|uniref:Uncharacterized protein n=1 Tax=Trichinella zimbabwensis TaxID=268475 RepID=A0A0V1GCQ8_9BILA|nr:hypothetical protein T11_18134 [Trichinella zimbabwensis]
MDGVEERNYSRPRTCLTDRMAMNGRAKCKRSALIKWLIIAQ